MTELQILVNHYREDEETVRRFLSSLAKQTGVDFEVLIASDGGDGLDVDWLRGYPYPISYARLPHTGVCHTRNVLLDRASADWIMLGDIDDEFASDGLCQLLEAAQGHDVAGSPYYAERMTSGGLQTGLIERDTLRVHGKLFRRRFLVDNSIRFPDEMETGGDMSFLWLAYMLGDTVWTDRPFYTWKWAPKTVTRGKPFFSYRAYDSMLTCYDLLADDLSRRGEWALRVKLIATVFAKMYADATNEAWWVAPADYRAMAEGPMRLFARKHIGVYRRTDMALRRRCHEVMRAHSGGGVFEGLMNWAEHIAS